jgi:hypothetical protein
MSANPSQHRLPPLGEQNRGDSDDGQAQGFQHGMAMPLTDMDGQPAHQWPGPARFRRRTTDELPVALRPTPSNYAGQRSTRAPQPHLADDEIAPEDWDPANPAWEIETRAEHDDRMNRAQAANREPQVPAHVQLGHWVLQRVAGAGAYAAGANDGEARRVMQHTWDTRHDAWLARHEATDRRGILAGIGRLAVGIPHALRRAVGQDDAAIHQESLEINNIMAGRPTRLTHSQRHPSAPSKSPSAPSGQGGLGPRKPLRPIGERHEPVSDEQSRSDQHAETTKKPGSTARALATEEYRRLSAAEIDAIEDPQQWVNDRALAIAGSEHGMVRIARQDRRLATDGHEDELEAAAWGDLLRHPRLLLPGVTHQQFVDARRRVFLAQALGGKVDPEDYRIAGYARFEDVYNQIEAEARQRHEAAVQLAAQRAAEEEHERRVSAEAGPFTNLMAAALLHRSVDLSARYQGNGSLRDALRVQQYAQEVFGDALADRQREGHPDPFVNMSPRERHILESRIVNAATIAMIERHLMLRPVKQGEQQTPEYTAELALRTEAILQGVQEIIDQQSAIYNPRR